MTAYEELLQEVADNGIVVHECVDFGNRSVSEDRHLLGLCYGNHVALARELESDSEKLCVLAEEFSHARYTVGNILDQNDVDNRKQERKDRVRSFDMLFGITGIANALKEGCQNTFEMAEYLGVTERTLLDAINCYREKYGQRIETDDYDLYFEPSLMLFAKSKG